MHCGCVMKEFHLYALNKQYCVVLKNKLRSLLLANISRIFLLPETRKKY